MSTLWNDVQYGLRMLAKSPGFTMAVILITAVAVGANTAIFNALNQLCLRPLPVNKARDLVGVYYLWCAPDGQSGTEGIFNYPVYEAFRDQPDVFAGLAAFSHEVMPLYTRQDIKQVQGLAVSGNYFSVLGLAPSRGRLFDPQQEPDAAAPPVVIISDRFRRRQFGEDEEVIGRQVILHGRSLTIVGVTPPGFAGSVVGWVADVYVPLGTYAAMTHNNFHRGTWTWLHFLGRLRPGIGREQAEARLSAVSAHLKESGLENVGNHVMVADGSRGYAEVARGLPRPLAILMAAAAFVLTIASLNIANMQLSRAMVRQREIAIRQALGAGRWRIVRQLSVEGLLLALAGGMCGVVLAIWLDRVVCGVVSRMGSVSMAGGIDSRVLLFALAASLLAGLVFGLAPALQAVRRDVTPSLKESSAFIGVFPSRWNPQHALTVILNAFSLAGLVLCVTGLYGVITCAVNRRTREIGIRMALGAQTRNVVLPILGQGLGLTVVGLGFGLGTSLLAMRVLKSQLPSLQHWDKFILYGVNVWDLATVIAVPFLLLSVAAIACTIPARRAAKIDPMEALRCE